MRYAIPCVRAQQVLQVTSPVRQLSEWGGNFLRRGGIRGTGNFSRVEVFFGACGEVKKNLLPRGSTRYIPLVRRAKKEKN